MAIPSFRDCPCWPARLAQHPFLRHGILSAGVLALRMLQRFFSWWQQHRLGFTWHIQLPGIQIHSMGSFESYRTSLLRIYDDSHNDDNNNNNKKLHRHDRNTQVFAKFSNPSVNFR